MIHDIGKYEASFSDAEDPGYYLIEKEGQYYIKITDFEIIDKELYCRFEIVKSDFTKEEIAELVFVVLLNKFCQNYYVGKVIFVKFIDITKKEEWRLAYVG